jgi:hypothetical protein
MERHKEPPDLTQLTKDFIPFFYIVPLRWDPVIRRETTLCYVLHFNAWTLLAYYYIVLRLANMPVATLLGCSILPNRDEHRVVHI